MNEEQPDEGCLEYGFFPQEEGYQVDTMRNIGFLFARMAKVSQVREIVAKWSPMCRMSDACGGHGGTVAWESWICIQSR